MSMRIYTMTHKKFTPLSDKLYVPLHVGRACGEDFGYQGDDTGEQISALNCYYSELTGFYCGKIVMMWIMSVPAITEDI